MSSSSPMVFRFTSAPSSWYFSDRVCRIVMRGFSDAYGSWNTICMSRRALRSSWVPSPVMSTPSSTTRPLVGSSSRRIARAVVDLPQPDSPTSATVWPRLTSNEIPLTAWT